MYNNIFKYLHICLLQYYTAKINFLKSKISNIGNRIENDIC